MGRVGMQKFLVMALKANPNILECLYSPLVEKVTPLGEELLAMRECFLSQMIFQTFSGYAMSQFKKIEQDRRTRGEVRWKHVMHLLRLLLSGGGALRRRPGAGTRRNGSRTVAGCKTWRVIVGGRGSMASGVTP
jgi:predicted nucleotidyltransferase